MGKKLYMFKSATLNSKPHSASLSNADSNPTTTI